MKFAYIKFTDLYHGDWTDCDPCNMAYVKVPWDGMKHPEAFERYRRREFAIILSKAVEYVERLCYMTKAWLNDPGDSLQRLSENYEYFKCQLKTLRNIDPRTYRLAEYMPVLRDNSSNIVIDMLPFDYVAKVGYDQAVREAHEHYLKSKINH